MTLDLLVESGSREAYYELSRLPAPFSEEPRVEAMQARLLQAIVLEADDQPVPLTVESWQFPSAPREEFLSPLAWPRTEVVLKAIPGSALRSAAQLRVRFLGSFRFEEPIATSFKLEETGRSMTRWLVAEQHSPRFDTGGWRGRPAAPAPSDDSNVVDTLLAYVGLGFVHILPLGYDHLLFVLGLCLGATSLRRLLVLLTLFTLAHTLSLGAVSLGLVPSSPRIVEPLILLTILWVAIENLRPQRRFALRCGVVLVFGLIHGMGFAGALKTVGLPAQAFFSALIGFNVGVELAQVVFVVAVLGLIQLVKARPWFADVPRAVSLSIAGVSALLAVRMFVS